MRKGVSAIYRAPIWNNTASLAVVDLTAFVAEAAKRHRLSAGARRAYGRIAICTAYLLSWVEEREVLSLTVSGKGTCGKFHIFGDGRLHLCGSVEHDADEASVEECVGSDGYLSVVRDGGEGLPFTGTCALVRGDVTSDIEGYFSESEQRPTAVCLYEGERKGENVCGGVFVQPLTGADESVLARAKSAVRACNASMTAEEILSLFGAEGAERREITFQCTCSREKAARAVTSLGEESVRAVLAAEGAVRVHCHECNTDYTFDGADVNALFANK